MAEKGNPLGIWEYYTAPEQGLAYLEIPKCACTSLKSAIARLVSDDPPTGWRVHQDFPRDFIKYDYNLDRERYLSFTFVRHPLDRFASFYRDKIQGPWDKAIAQHLERIGLRSKMGVGDVITALERHETRAWEKHVRPQHVFLFTGKGTLAVDFIGRMERMSEDWTRLMSMAELDLDLAHEHRQREKAPVQLTRRQLDELRALYERDLRLLGYDWPALKPGDEAYGVTLSHRRQRSASKQRIEGGGGAGSNAPTAGAREKPDGGNPAEAAALARSAAERCPDEFEPHFQLALALEELADLAGAKLAYAEALAVDPTHPRAVNAHAGFARVLERLGEDDAAAWHREAVASLGGNMEAASAGTEPAGEALPVLYLGTTRGQASGEYAIKRARDRGSAAVPPVELMEYRESAQAHLEGGRRNVQTMLKTVRSCGFRWSACDRVLEFGCSNGRLLRWLANHADDCELWGVDIQSDKILWATENLSPPLRFATTTTVPQLPFPDRHFDLIFAGSVFTHLGELHIAWLLELARVLSSRGFLYVTVHDETSLAEVLAGKPPRFARLRQHFGASERAHALRSGKFGFVSVAPYGDAMLSQVAMSSAYIDRITQPFLRRVGRVPRAYAGFQSAYVFRSQAPVHSADSVRELAA